MIEYADESGYEPTIDGEEIVDLARYVLAEMRIHPGADLSVMLVPLNFCHQFSQLHLCH